MYQLVFQSMYFYAQQVDIDKPSGRHDVILDVQTSDAHVRLASALGDSRLQDRPADEAQASMLQFSYTPSGRRGFKEGSWYDIDLAAFENMRYEIVNPDAAGASFLRARLTGNPRDGNFAQYLTKLGAADISPSNLEIVVDPNPTGDIELTIVDCGHGNWNEIRTAADRLIYDVGASRRFTKPQVRNLVASRNIASETRAVSVVISHWDVDHFHALLEFQPAELQKLRAVFVPSQVPDTRTYRRVRERLTDNNVDLAALQPAARPGTSKAIVLVPTWQRGIFTVFRATSGRSRNQTGIALGIRGPREVALLTGDHHYEKVLAAAASSLGHGQPSCVLVAPHHGGLAGRPSAPDWLAAFSCLTTPISCGPNSYGHPMAAIEKELKAMQAGAPILRTDVAGTWTRTL